MSKQSEKVAAILKAVELYAEAGRKGSREIGQQAFTEQATMSWVENGKITTVPITALYDGLEQTGEEEVTYEVEDVTVAGDVAYVRISSTFSKLGSYDDMFTLAKQDGEWKIVSKIYHTKLIKM
ncbi:MAG: nuclear transport factor 2 family protein [Prevotella sp.]|nr:nuclear transport factor 2 family protein [Prevotella sp.]